MRTKAPGHSTSDGPEKLLQSGSGEGQYRYMIFVKEEYMQSHTYFSRKFLLVSWRFLLVTGNSHHQERFLCFLRYEEIQELGSSISYWDYLSEDLFFKSFLPLPTESASFLLSAMNSFQRVLKVSSCSSTWFNPCRGRRQAPLASAYLQLTTLSMGLEPQKWSMNCYNLSLSKLSSWD